MFSGKVLRTCATSCPQNQVAVRGVCHDFTQADFSSDIRLADILFQPQNEGTEKTSTSAMLTPLNVTTSKTTKKISKRDKLTNSTKQKSLIKSSQKL